jgi:hypothetical protein
MIRRSAFLVVTACFVLGLGERAVAFAQRAPRVSLGSVSVAGPVPKAEARRGLRRALPGFQRCYETRLGARPELAGRMKIRLFVSSDGSPVVAQVDESDVGDEALDRCLQDAAMTLSFTEHETADSHVSFELRFGDTGRPSSTPHTVSAGPDDPRFLGEDDTRELRPQPPAALRAVVRPELVELRGPRRRPDVEAALRRAMPRMRRCYEDALARDRRLAGDLEIGFAIDAAGRTRDVSPGDAIDDPALVACLGRAVEAMRFAPTSGAAATVKARVLLRPPAGLDETRRASDGQL